MFYFLEFCDTRVTAAAGAAAGRKLHLNAAPPDRSAAAAAAAPFFAPSSPTCLRRFGVGLFSVSGVSED